MCCAALLGLSVTVSGRERAWTFSMPDSALLFATYEDVRISTPTGVQALKPPVDVTYNGGYFTFPSLSPKGDAIAWGFAVALDKRRSQQGVFTLGIYSIALHEWKTYGDFDFIGYPAFSRDGSKVAVIAMTGEDNPQLLIFDRTTERMTRGPYHRGMQASRPLSWSPEWDSSGGRPRNK
jgi:hypothetical protein